MTYDHQCEIDGCTVGFRPGAVHIHNDEGLLAHLQGEGSPALALAQKVREAYERLIGQALDISEHSLAIEILGHVFADKVATALEEVRGNIAQGGEGLIARVLDRVQRGAEVIDCGEAHCDSNRFVWDMLVPFRGAIYAMAR